MRCLNNIWKGSPASDLGMTIPALISCLYEVISDDPNAVLVILYSDAAQIWPPGAKYNSSADDAVAEIWIFVALLSRVDVDDLFPILLVALGFNCLFAADDCWKKFCARAIDASVAKLIFVRLFVLCLRLFFLGANEFWVFFFFFETSSSSDFGNFKRPHQVSRKLKSICVRIRQGIYSSSSNTVLYTRECELQLICVCMYAYTCDGFFGFLPWNFCEIMYWTTECPTCRSGMSRN